MPRQNRVNPFGDLIATVSYGTFMGNRGVLHDKNGNLTRKRWTHTHWIACVLEFKDSKEKPRSTMSPGYYTELFFLDEATALAAGHRPCALCRREAFNRFKEAWINGNAHLDLPKFVGVAEIDRILQRERATDDGGKVTFEAVLKDLPNGTMVILPNETNTPGLVWKERIYPWSFDGYREPVKFQLTDKVQVLTPASTVNALKFGFIPEVSI